MKKIRIFVLVILLALSSLAFARVGGETRKVLVVIWDGTEWKEVERLATRGLLPNLASVGALHHLTANQDCFGSGEAELCMQTETAPQHTTMLTGCLADVHGIFTNTEREVIPDSITIYEQIEAQDANIKTAHLVNKPRQIGEVLFGNAISDVDAFKALKSKPKLIANLAINLIRQWSDQDFMIVVHFKTPDEIGHHTGVESKQYRQAILKNDVQLGRILRTLTQYGILDKTQVYVLSDHGFGCPDENIHRCSPNTFIASNDPGVNDLMMKDVAGLLLANFGIPVTGCGH